MGVQTRILKRTMTQTITVDGKPKSFTSATGALVGGIPGKIFSVAYGPVVHGVCLPSKGAEDETMYEIGTLLPKQGVIINAPEYALVGGLKPSLFVKAGTAVSCMTAGQVWVTKANAELILAAMNGSVIFDTAAAPSDPDDSNDSAEDDEDRLVVVEVNGFKG